MGDWFSQSRRIQSHPKNHQTSHRNENKGHLQLFLFIFRGRNHIIQYHKTLSNNKTFTNLREIEEYVRQCELRRLDLDNDEVWSKAYLPATRITNSPGVYEGCVEFHHVQDRLISSNEPLLGCGPLPDWLHGNRCIYSVDNEDDNLCVWRCLVISDRIRRNQARPAINTTRDALKLAQKFYNQPNLRVSDVRLTKLIDSEKITSMFKVNITLYEPKNQSTWKLVFGQNHFKNSLSNVDIGLYEGHCFYIKDLDVLANHCRMPAEIYSTQKLQQTRC